MLSNKIIRYRVYGVVDVDTEGIGEVLEDMRQYGSAVCIDAEVLTGDECNEVTPLAEDDFMARYKEIK